MADDVAGEVGVVAHAGIDADEACELRGIVGRVLQCRPGRFQEHALLRIHQRGHTRVHAEEGRIELVGIADHAAGLDIIRVVPQFSGYTGVDLIHRPFADAVLLGQQVLPQFLHGACPRESS